MLFCDLAIAWESRRLGDKRALHRLKFEMEDALSAYAILFPDKEDTFTETMAILKVATELETPVEILRELLTGSVSQLLASESSDASQSRFTLDEVLRLRKAILKDFAFLSTSKQLSEPEARLFWSTLVRDRAIITRGGFLTLLGSQLEIKADVIRGSRAYLSDEDIIECMFDNPERLFNPTEWHHSPRVALKKRPLYSWNKQRVNGLDEYNGALYQEIPMNGVTELSMDSDKEIIVERAKDGTVVDAVFPSHPDLELQDRLAMYHDSRDVQIAWPVPIPSWHALMKIDDNHSVRFPNTSAYNPSEEGGYLLVRDHHIHNLRLDSYKQETDGSLVLRLQAMDGYDDYVDACLCTVCEPSDKTSLMFHLDRLMPNRTKGEADWVVIPIDHCVVVSVSSPFIDRTTNMLSSPSYMSLRDGMGIENVTQYVDLIGGSHG
jgi:hypothetical protein